MPGYICPLGVMPIRCEVCSSSFKDSKALQMHQAAKCYKNSTAAQSSKLSKDQREKILDPYHARSATRTTRKEAGSSNPIFRCDTCKRSFKSHEALATHIKAKKHPITPTSRIEVPVEDLFRCDVCGRGDFKSQNALQNHKRYSKGHQPNVQLIASVQSPSNLRNGKDQGLLPHIEHAPPLRVDKSVQCDLCSCDGVGYKAHESLFTPSWGVEQQLQDMSMMDARDYHQQVPAHGFYGGNAIFYQSPEMNTFGENSAAGTTSDPLSLARETYYNDAPPAIFAETFDQLTLTEHLHTPHPLIPQSSPNLVDVGGLAQAVSLDKSSKGWSVILPSEVPSVWNMLKDLCHSASDLEKFGYRLHQHTDKDLMEARKCRTCRRQQKDIKQPHIPCKASLRQTLHSSQVTRGQVSSRNASKRAEQGDCALPSHNFPTIDERKKARYLESSWTPTQNPQNLKRPAVALDCEMVEVHGSDALWQEVVKISAVDFLNGETLINTLVLPKARVRSWRTEITGITKETMSKAKAQGLALNGWSEARSRLWQHIDAETILIGQSLYHDLEVLGMLHTRIVDSAILASQAIGLPGTKTIGLRKMCKELLGMDIQDSNGGIHESLEDALASRELVLYIIRNPGDVQTWALSKREEELEKKAMRERQRKEKITAASHEGQGKRRAPANSNRNSVSDSFIIEVANDDGHEILRWEDMAEDLGWPHPDTGYDPWSD